MLFRSEEQRVPQIRETALQGERREDGGELDRDGLQHVHDSGDAGRIAHDIDLTDLGHDLIEREDDLERWTAARDADRKSGGEGKRGGRGGGRMSV